VLRDGAEVVLEVEDTGHGIAEAERARVFDRFYRVLGTRAEGSGLGLAIVREIAEQHDARVSIHTPPKVQNRLRRACCCACASRARPYGKLPMRP